MQVALLAIKLEIIMAQKRKPHLKNGTGVGAGTPKKRKEKGETQVHPFTMVMVVGPTGKKRMEKRYK